MVKRKNASGNPWAKKIKTAFATGKTIYDNVKTLQKRYGSKSSSVPRGITTQHDSRLIYKRKAMPKYKKKAYRKFTKKVQSVEIQSRGKQTHIYSGNTTTSWDYTTDGIDIQGYHETHLYGTTGTSVSNLTIGLEDVGLIFDDVNTYAEAYLESVTGTIAPSGLTATDQAPNQEKRHIPILFHSASVDITYTNTGSGGLEFDLYLISYPRNPTSNSKVSLGAAIDQAYYNTNHSQTLNGNIPGSSSIVPEAFPRMNYRGVTPFDMARGLATCGARILSKEKFFIAPGNSITKRISDTKNHTIWLPNSNNGGFNCKYTQSYVAIAKSITSGTAGQFQTKATRNYHFTVNGVKTPAACYRKSV